LEGGGVQKQKAEENIFMYVRELKLQEDRKVHNKDHRDVYYSENNDTVINSRKTILARHVACMKDVRNGHSSRSTTDRSSD